MRNEFRLGLILAAALAALPASAASAQEWCGYATHQNAVIECGYTTASECESAVGKGGMCFLDPDLALNSERAAPSWPGIAVRRTASLRSPMSRPSTTLVSIRN